jgi:hypothetical protein
MGVEKGKKKKTCPKYATEHDQPTVASQDKRMGGAPSISSDKSPRAGKIPTKPAAKGIVPVATAVVCTTIISWGVRGALSIRETKKPMRADCMDILTAKHCQTREDGNERNTHRNPSGLQAQAKVCKTYQTANGKANSDSSQGELWLCTTRGRRPRVKPL